MDAGHRCLEINDAPGPRGSLLETAEPEHRGNVPLVVCAHGRHFGTRRYVVIAIRHTESTLQQVWRVVVRIGQALCDEHAEEMLGLEVRGIEWIDVGAQRRTDCPGELAFVLDRGNRI